MQFQRSLFDAADAYDRGPWRGQDRGNPAFQGVVYVMSRLAAGFNPLGAVRGLKPTAWPAVTYTTG